MTRKYKDYKIKRVMSTSTKDGNLANFAPLKDLALTGGLGDVITRSFLKRALCIVFILGISQSGAWAQSTLPVRASATPAVSGWEQAMLDLRGSPTSLAGDYGFLFGIVSLRGPAFFSGALALTSARAATLSPTQLWPARPRSAFAHPPSAL